jgi:hypothetical protein
MPAPILPDGQEIASLRYHNGSRRKLGLTDAELTIDDRSPALHFRRLSKSNRE